MKLVERFQFTNTIALRRLSSMCVEYTEMHNVTLCCNFNIDYTELNTSSSAQAYTYRLSAFIGTRIYSINRRGELHCTIVACLNDNENSCGHRFQNTDNLVNRVIFDKIDIQASVLTDDKISMVMSPNPLDTSILPLEVWHYTFDWNITE